jgi:hypothetical protein
MRRRMAQVQRPSGLIKVEGSASALKGSNLLIGRECGVEVNIDLKSLLYRLFHCGKEISYHHKTV